MLFSKASLFGVSMLVFFFWGGGCSKYYISFCSSFMLSCSLDFMLF